MYYIVSCIDLYYAGHIAYLYCKVVGRHWLIVCSWQYADEHCLKAFSGGIYKEFMLDCLKAIEVLLLIYILTYIPPFALIEACDGIIGNCFITMHS